MIDAPRSSRVQILQVADCPLVDRLARDLEDCLVELAVSAPVQRFVGDYPSPTLVIDGLDISTNSPVANVPRCRLDLPSKQQIRAALTALKSPSAWSR